MLVLSRKVGQSIQIGEDVNVEVVSVKNGQVRLGVRAPNSVPVHREEIFAQIEKQKRGSDERPKLSLVKP